MPFLQTPIPDLVLFEPKVWQDDRGYFYEAFNHTVFAEAGITRPFVQDNQAQSVRGVLRGLHYQIGEYAQAKLVRVLAGEVLDIAVDIREDSKTYGEVYSVILSAENKRQLYVPRGFAHGYIVLSETANFFYKCDNYYAKSQEGGIIFNDATLAIDWGLPEDQLILSEKDLELPTFGKHRISSLHNA